MRKALPLLLIVFTAGSVAAAAAEPPQAPAAASCVSALVRTTDARTARAAAEPGTIPCPQFLSTTAIVRERVPQRT